MSENTGSTQPMQVKEDDTQPLKPVKKPARWKSILIGVLGFLVLVGLGAFGGYRNAVTIRQNTEEEIITQQLGEQFQYALVDIQFGRYDTAKQRLEFIIQHDPSFPGAAQQYQQVLVLSNVPSATPTASLTPTPDFSGAQSAFDRAQQLIAAQDWVNGLAALDQVRKLDPTYKTSLVDGMYFFALRNYGVALIGQGNLEGGIYHITLAERFGPIDNTARVLRDNARQYLVGASFWELDWKLAVDYFSALGGANLWDGTMTSAQRLQYAYMRYGDKLFAENLSCNAIEMYKNAQAISALDAAAEKNYNQAYQQCYPATAVVPTTGLTTVPAKATTPASTNPPTSPPTQAPTQAPTNPPSTNPPPTTGP